METLTDIREGCYVDSHEGQYMGHQIVAICDDLCGTTLSLEWPLDEDGSPMGTYGPDGDVWAGLNGDDYVELMVSLMDRTEYILNDTYATATHSFGWNDGDFGYYNWEEG